MKKHPKVTYALLCYNQKRFVEMGIRNAISQDYDNIEFIVLDDCSKDKSVDIIKSLEEQIRNRFSTYKLIFNEKNCGICANMNRILSIASGEYIKIFACDDLLPTNYFSVMVEYFQNHQSCQYALSSVIKMPDNMKLELLKQFVGEKLFDINSVKTNGIFKRLLKSNFLPSQGELCRTEFVRKIGGYDENLKFEDWDFILNVSQNTQIGFVDGTCAFYRIAENSTSNYSEIKDIELRTKKYVNMYEGGRDTLLKYVPKVNIFYRIYILGWYFATYNIVAMHHDIEYTEEIAEDAKKAGILVYLFYVFSFRIRKVIWKIKG